MIRSLLKTTLAAAALALTGAAFAQAANELVVWHAYRGAEKTAFEKAVSYTHLTLPTNREV